MGTPNYKNPAFWKRGYQTLLATAVIGGALIGRVSPTQIPVAMSRIDKTPKNSKTPNIIITENTQSPGLENYTTPTSFDNYTRRTPQVSILDDTWRLYYESNR